MNMMLTTLRRLRQERDQAIKRAELAERLLETARRDITAGINERNRLWVILTKNGIAHQR